jgi:hypothetical protein
VSMVEIEAGHYFAVARLSVDGLVTGDEILKCMTATFVPLCE